MQYRDLGARPCGHMSEFEGDVAAAYEYDPGRQFIEFQELIACDQMAFAGDVQGRGPRPRCDHYISGLEEVIPNADGGGTREPRAAMKRGDAGLLETLLSVSGHRLGEGPLELHQIRPNDPRRAGDPFAIHPAISVDHFGGSDQNLLRIAPTQRAGSAEWPGIDHRDLPTGGTAAISDRGCRCAGADDYEIKHLCHTSMSS